MFTMLLCILAGAGAGIGIGFASMSSATVIGPVLLTFLGVAPYQAIGIGLACDVLASAVGAVTYAKEKYVDLKRSISVAVSVLLFTVIGSLLASFFPAQLMGTSSIASTIVMAVIFLMPQGNKKKKVPDEGKKNKKIVIAVIFGAGIGLGCGAFGAGGGMMILLVLTGLLGYDFKTAAGTSLTFMTLISLFGAVSHMSFGQMPELPILFTCMASTAIFARIAAHIATRLDPTVSRRITGVILMTLAIIVLGSQMIAG